MDTKKKGDGGGYDQEWEHENEEFNEMFVEEASKFLEEEDPEFAAMMNRIKAENADKDTAQED